MQKKISIIIPVYNDKENLGFALFSIQKQNANNDIEVIIIDDCSDCNYKEEIERFQLLGMDIKYFRNDKNVGAGLSRQKGIEHATGEYIAFLDSDDYYNQKWYQTVIKYIKKYPIISVFEYALYICSKKEAYVRSCHLGCYVIKKEFIEENNIKFHDSLRIFEDLYFIEIVAYISIYKNQFKLIGDIIYYYRDERENSTLHRLGEKNLDAYKETANVQRVLWFIENNPEVLYHSKEIEEKYEKIQSSFKAKNQVAKGLDDYLRKRGLV